MTFKIPSKISLAFQVSIWITFFFAVLIVIMMDFRITPKKIVPVVLTNVILNIILVNIHLYFLIPNFFKQRRKGLFFLILIVLIFFFSWAKAVVMYTLKPADVAETLLMSKGLKISIVTTLMMLILTLPLLFVDEILEKKVQAVELKNKALQTELQFLKMQVRPHFLFNILNNVYSMIYTNNKNAGPTILKLSGLMRYMLYDTSESMVLLQKEITYLQEYIDLQTIKQRDQSTVLFSTGELPKDLRIQPFLLIPFLENAFKHSNWDSQTGKGWIRAQVSFEKDCLIFNLSNSLSSPMKKKSIHGIGLKNVQQRLNLFYPEKHQLKIEHKEESYHVYLQIQFA